MWTQSLTGLNLLLQDSVSFSSQYRTQSLSTPSGTREKGCMVAMLESIEAFYLETTDRFLETSIGSDARKEQDRNDSGVGC